MVFEDAWIEGLTEKQQNLVIDYVMDGCKVKSGQGGYKNAQVIKRFINSEKGRKAVRSYCDFFFDKKKDIVKLQMLKIYMQRAFFNPADIIDEMGRLKIPKNGDGKTDMRKLGDLAFCIDGIETKIHAGGIATVKTALCDRDKAMEFIAQLFKIFEDEEETDPSDYKSVYEMTDEERDEEIQMLMKKEGLLPPPENENGKDKKKKKKVKRK